MGLLLDEPDFITRLATKRLTELQKTRAKVEEHERRVTILSDYEAERRRLAFLNRLASYDSAQRPQLRDMGMYVAELRQYLQSMLDADVLGDYTLQTLACEHCVAYSLRLLDLLPDMTQIEIRESLSVMELAASTLAMLSKRPSAIPVFLQASALPILARALSPLFPSVVIINLASAIGNMADDLDVRLLLRAQGGISALVRLLKPDVEAPVQMAAAAALQLLAVRDLVVQDSVRFLGGIDLLVELMASSDTRLAEVAQNCLVSLRQGNSDNERETAEALQASSGELARELSLRLDEDTNTVHALIARLDTLSAGDRPATAKPLARSLTGTSSIGFRPETAASTGSRARTPIKLFDSGFQLPSSAATIRYATPSAKDFNLPNSPGGSVAAAGDSWTLRTTQVEVEKDLLRKKHLTRFSCEEVCLLLEDLGLDSLDLRGFRMSRTSGSTLLAMTEEELSVGMLLMRSKVRKVLQLQRATDLFDRIATLPRQGRISEIELRLYLAGHGAGNSEVNKVIRLFRTLVHTDRYDFVTYWDFVTSFEWVNQAFHIYNIPTE